MSDEPVIHRFPTHIKGLDLAPLDDVQAAQEIIREFRAMARSMGSFGGQRMLYKANTLESLLRRLEKAEQPLKWQAWPPPMPGWYWVARRSLDQGGGASVEALYITASILRMVPDDCADWAGPIVPLAVDDGGR